MRNRTPVAEDVELAPLLDEILEDLIDDPSVAEIRIDLPEVAHTHWSVLRLLLHTLVSNAVRHSSAGLELGVGSFLRGEQECYFVENTWVTTHRSPESFVQTERGETAADRFGMRLGLCKRAALVLGGDLWLAPTVEKFRVEFTLGKTK